MNHDRALALFSAACLAFLSATTILTACETETPTKAVVENGYPELPDGGDPATQIVVYRTWYVATLFTDPVPPAATSDERRSVPATDMAYALLAPGWDSAGTTPPTTLIAVRSKAKLSVSRGDVLHISVSDALFSGSCAAKQPLSQDDADFITQRIFPGEFIGATYVAKTCVTTRAPMDGGGEAGDDGGADAGPD